MKSEDMAYDLYNTKGSVNQRFAEFLTISIGIKCENICTV